MTESEPTAEPHGDQSQSPFEWDASRYGSLPLPHVGWGQGVIRRLHLRGREHVLDLGCGTGRDLAALLATHAGIHAIGIDASQNMLDEAARALAPFADRAQLRRADLTRRRGEPGALELAEPVDAVMSVAALHWIADHALVFDTVSDVLRPGGRFVVDAGGAGNIARFDAALDRVLGSPQDDDGRENPWTFASAKETADLLGAAGFVDVHARLREAPVRLPEEAFPAYVATVMLGKHLSRLDARQGEQLVRDVVAAVGEPVVDYVRLEFEAIRP